MSPITNWITDPNFQQILDAKVLGLACISDDMASSTRLVEMIKTIFALKDKIIAQKNKEIEIKSNNIFSLSQQLNTIKFYKKYKNQEERSDENKTLKDHEIDEKDLEITEIKGVYSSTQIEEKMSRNNDSNFSEISNKNYKHQEEESSDENKTLKDHEIAEKGVEITEIKGVYSLTQIEEKMSPINDSNFSEITDKNYKDQDESSDENKTLKDHEIAEKDLELQGILWQSEQNNLALLRICIYFDFS